MPSTNYRAVLLLLFIPAVTVELLSGNTKFGQYFTPQIFVIFNILYGVAAILVREALVRWNKGLGSLMLLGLAYGMVNEGLCSKGFFDPHFYAVVAFGLENVARYFGINVAWAFSISAIHCIFSITVPILLVSALFAGGTRWLGDKVLLAMLILFIATVVFCLSLLGNYHPEPGPLILVIALIVSVVAAARVLPNMTVKKFANPPADNILLLCGALYAVALFASAIELHKLVPFVAFDIATVLGLLLLFLWLMLKLPELSGRSQVALVAGMLAPQICTSACSGGLLQSAVVVILLLVIWIKCKQAATPQVHCEPTA